jgi:hypothetical protein
MPSTPISGSGAIGGTYVVTSTLSDWTDSKSLLKSGSSTTSSIITIDNLSPADVTSFSGTSGNGQVSFTWSNPGDADFATTTLVRTTSTSGVTVRPTEGTYYTVGQTISATNTIACVVASSTANCTDSGLANGTTYYYMAFTADNFLNYSSGTAPTGNPFTPSANQAPTVSSISLNHGNAIILTPNATTSIDINWSVSDANGCTDINTNTATSTAFRFGVRSTCAVPNPATNNLNCYRFVTRATSSCSGTTINVTDTVQIYYFAQATDASSSFPSDAWEAFALVSDAANATGSATSTNVALNTLLAINITTSSINYGTVKVGSDTGSTNQTTTIANAGNCSTTLKVSGTAPTSGGNALATSSQHYATSSFTYNINDTLLSDTPTAISGVLLTAPTSTNFVSTNIFWGIGIPALTTPGIYNATNTFTAVFNP